MRELDEILRLRRSIANLEERIEELRVMTQPKAQVISDMPRGGGEARNSIEDYIVKSEELTEKRDGLLHDIDEKWDVMYAICREANISVEQITMLRYRFYSGNSWKNCLNCMIGEFPAQKWNEQRLFRLYRGALCKISKRKGAKL